MEESTEVVESTAVEVYTPKHETTTLFRTDDPVEVIKRASDVANALKSVLVRQGLTTRIQGRDHVQVEGWTTCGAMLGVVPVVEWTRPLPNGWEARVIARTLDGRTIGGAEASCTRDEKKWRDSDDYALRGMAQTRATSRALRGPLGFIVTLAGYAATPAEEMDGITVVQAESRSDQPTAAPPKPSERQITANQRTKLLIPRAKKAGLTDGEFANIILQAAGDPPRVWRTEEHASQTLTRLLDRMPARLKDAVLERIDAVAKEWDE